MDISVWKPFAELGVMVLISVAFVVLVFKIGFAVVSHLADLVQQLAAMRSTLERLETVMENLEGFLHRQGVEIRTPPYARGKNG